MMTLLSILFLGFSLGMRHATDSDHVVAVTTIVSRQRSIGSAAWTGVFWGIGHTVTLLVVGGAIIFFGIVIPQRVGMSLEFGVALMLILLGTLNLHGTVRLLRNSTASAEAMNADLKPNNGWRNAFFPAGFERLFGRLQHDRAIKPAIIGVVHGLAGSAAVALLVVPLIQRPIWGFVYLLVFGLGTIAGMMLITATIAVPITYSTRYSFFQRYFGTAAGVLSVAFGIFLAYQIGFVDGLFTR
ncbi:MAG: high-affinity nickel-transport family protein [Chthoniobacterales bacterium]